MKRDSIDTYRLPFTLDEVLDELRMLLWVTASQIALTGKAGAVEAFVPADFEFGMSERPGSEVPRIDLEDYDITRTVRDAYDFAFQINDPGRFSGDDWGDLLAFVQGSARSSWSGETSPVLREDSKLLHVADMVNGRVHLMTGDALSIRELALLARMTESAVRSALSTEGIKTEGRPASLTAEIAAKWLPGRRGFVPTAYGTTVRQLADSDVKLQLRAFPEALADLLRFSDAGQISDQAGLDHSVLEGLRAGEPVDVGVRGLLRLASVLRQDPETFVAAYARFIASSTITT